MHPELFSIGPFVVHTYGVLVGLGIVLSLFLATGLAKKTGFPPSKKVFDLFSVGVLAGFLGARIFYVAQEWGYYRGHLLEMFEIWEGGLIYYGGVVGTFLGLVVYARRLRVSLWAVCDFLIPYIALTHAFGRVGCFFAGCCYGKQGIPVQLFEAVFNFILFGLLSRWYERRRFPGEIFAVYLVLYPAGRFFFEFLRGDQGPWLFSLTFQQILSAALVLLGLALYGISRPRR